MTQSIAEISITDYWNLESESEGDFIKRYINRLFDEMDTAFASFSDNQQPVTVAEIERHMAEENISSVLVDASGSPEKVVITNRDGEQHTVTTMGHRGG